MKSKSKGKTPQNNTDPIELSKSRTWENFIDKDVFLIYPGKNESRKRFMLAMLRWAEQEDSLEITDFAIEMRIRRQTIYEWAEKYQDLKETFEFVKLMLGSRKRKGALLRKYDKDVAFKDMHKYDPEWLEINQYHAKLKDQEQGNEKKVVILESMCSHEDHK
jgi:hypothetical protein